MIVTSFFCFRGLGSVRRVGLANIEGLRLRCSALSDLLVRLPKAAQVPAFPFCLALGELTTWMFSRSDSPESLRSVAPNPTMNELRALCVFPKF